MSTKQIDKFATELEIPQGVNVSLKSYILNVEGPLGKTFKNFKKIPVGIEVTDDKILLKAQGTRAKNYAIMKYWLLLVFNLRTEGRCRKSTGIIIQSF